MRKKHAKVIHLTKHDIKDVKHIQKTTSSFYNKKGNCNSMVITYNTTTPKYNMNTLKHYRSTDNTKLSSKNLARYIDFTK